MNERRIRERVPFQLDLHVYFQGQWITDLQSCDLSMGGVQLQSECDWGLTGGLLLRLCIPDSPEFPELRIQAEVMRREQGEGWYRWGLRFMVLDSPSSMYLYRIIQYHRN